MLVRKKEIEKQFKKNVNFTEGNFNDIQVYLKILGLEDNTDGVSYVVNEILKNAISRDKDFQAEKKKILSEKVSKVDNSTENKPHEDTTEKKNGESENVVNDSLSSGDNSPQENEDNESGESKIDFDNLDQVFSLNK